MATNVLQVNTAEFKKEVLDSEIPVLVDFWAEWCMPCRMIVPVIDELSGEYKGKIKFVKINVDNNTELTTELQILSIPTLVIFKDGKVVKRVTGANPKNVIEKEIKSVLT